MKNTFGFMAVPKKRKSHRKTSHGKKKFFHGAWAARDRAQHLYHQKQSLRSKYRVNIRENLKLMSTTSVRRIKPYLRGFKTWSAPYDET